MQKNKFIEKAKLVHGDKYDYSLLLDEVDYKIKIDIICPHHGVFKTNPNNHLRGKGCFKCAVELRKKIFVMSKDEFIKRANEAHNNKYNYSKVVYVNNHNKVCIICPDHGEFWQTPSKHILRKHGCRKCGMKNKSQCQTMNTKIFIDHRCISQKLPKEVEVDLKNLYYFKNFKSLEKLKEFNEKI